MKKCFVVTPIGNEGTDIRKRADQVFKYIVSPVCEAVEFEPIRVDKINSADEITQTILDYLKSAELVIADMSCHNPNAFYEMGYRAAIGKPMIHLKEKNEKIPFDVSGIRAFDYDLGDLDSVDEVKNRLIKTIKAFNIVENTLDTKPNSDSIEVKESQLLSVLYDIQDQIIDLKNEIHNKDTETIQAVVKAATPTAPIESTETALIKALLPELLRNPQSLKTLMEIGEMGNNAKK